MNNVVLKEEFQRKSYRHLKIAREIRKAIDGFFLIEYNIGMDISNVNLTKDLKDAIITISIPVSLTLQKSLMDFFNKEISGKNELRKEIKSFIDSKKKEINHYLSKKIYLKHLPRITFHYEDQKN